MPAVFTGNYRITFTDKKLAVRTPAATANIVDKKDLFTGSLPLF